MGNTGSNDFKYNIPEYGIWDEETEECLVLRLDPNVLMYHTLEYNTHDEVGTYAYCKSLFMLKKLHDDLIDHGRFLPSELTFGKLPNIKALVILQAKLNKEKANATG